MNITIGREHGSGGKQIGALVAKKLNIPFYDKEILTRTAKEKHIDEKVIQSIDEKSTGGLFYSLFMGNFPIAGYTQIEDVPIYDQIFNYQCSTIEKIASEGPSVLIGRCADTIIKNRLSVFISAPISFREQRAIEYYNQDPKKAKDYCLKKDKQRASYYKYYTDQNWGAANNYDLSLNSAKFKSLDDVANIIVNIYKSLN